MKAGRKGTPQEVKDRMIRLYADGVSAQTIASRMGFTKQFVHRVVKEAANGEKENQN